MNSCMYSTHYPRALPQKITAPVNPKRPGQLNVCAKIRTADHTEGNYASNDGGSLAVLDELLLASI